MPLEAILKYPVVFAAGLLSVLAMTPLWKRWALSWGFIDQPGGRKIHSTPVPVGGGMAIFVGFHVACAVVFLLPWQPFGGQISIDWWFRFIPLSVGVVALGLLDDRVGIKPWVKLAGQTLLALGAYALNIRMQNVMGVDLPLWVDFCGTILWFLAIMNAFNLIDGIDGLATGIALIAALGIGISLLFRRSPGDVLLFVGFAGACLGFLRYNYYPASVFLGDTGSLFVGFTLAALTISTSSKGPAIAAIGMPLLAVGVPLFDSVLAVWRRSIRRVLNGNGESGERVSIDQADAEHLHHRLLGQGRKHDQVARLLYAATALLALTGILTTVFNDKAVGILGIAFVVTAYTVVRHLAWIELRETGEVVLQGIAKPVRRKLSLIIYILVDLIILNLAWFASVLLMELQNGAVPVDLKSVWLRSSPVDIIIPFLILLGFRAYSRTWSLAGIVEYVKIGIAGLIGGLTACAIHLLFVPAGGNPWAVVLQKTILFGLAIPAIVGVRSVFRFVQDTMSRSGKATGPRVLVAGGGSDLMLYLRHRAMGQTSNQKDMIAGILSDDEALRGCYIDGFQVLGTLQEMPALIRQHDIQGVHRVGDAAEGELEALRENLQDAGIRLVHWKIVAEDVELA